MNLSQRCQYALRAALDLALHLGEGPVRIADIAERQAIPVRFLEQILVDLKRGGFARSHRGARGGYELAVAPAALAAGEIIRFVDGPVGPANGQAAAAADWPLSAECALMGMYGQARDAAAAVYDGTSFADLAERHVARGQVAGSYCI